MTQATKQPGTSKSINLVPATTLEASGLMPITDLESTVLLGGIEPGKTLPTI